MKRNILFIGILLLLSNCNKEEPILSTTATYPEIDSISFAIIGDYGHEGDPAFQVSEMVKSWSPDLVLTLGDNNYSIGRISTFYKNVGQYYCDFIYNPDAPEEHRCNGIATAEKQNRFFPTLGNHDQLSEDGSEPYLALFTLPGEEIYYNFRRGPVEFFTINSGREGEATCCDSEQAKWLENALKNSVAPFKVVYFHHPPYSSSHHGNTQNMQWPFKEWGASIVLSGHSHQYERISKLSDPDFYYLVNGLGGKENLHDCNVNPLDVKEFDHFCYNGDFGAIKVEANKERMKLKFINISNAAEPVDEVIIYR